MAFLGFVVYLDFTVRAQFEGRRWAVPAHVYARALELYPGQRLAAETFAAELARLGYRRRARPAAPGTYRRRGSEFEVVTRPFVFWDGRQPAQHFRVRFAGGRVEQLERLPGGSAVALVRLEPPAIGSIHPARHEDRVLVQLAQVPRELINALVAVEDHDFFTHHGIDPRAVARALWANVKAGRTVQGGSTLTQQLVKNFYLSAERTLTRKLLEIVMALLLELHYDKKEILEAYINEVYLGQQGRRAIHGFGLAAWFYFRRPLSELKLAEIALLAALVRGPSYYNPRRHPQRALARRNFVLAEMAERGYIDSRRLAAARAAPLGVTARPPGGAGAYPAFLELVRRQLRRDYREQDLRAEGLQVFTTLDPVVQAAVQRTVSRELRRLEERRPAARPLEAAVVVARTADGEVLALAGGRRGAFAGFNRALDARRPVGSLIKPFVYLPALSRPERYTLATLLDDSALRWRGRGSAKVWAPRNYDGRYHGRVTLRAALAHSYNIATARLGLAIGIDTVARTLRRAGLSRPIPPYPSALLGAVEMTPFEVAGLYQVLASGGFRMPLRAIRAVVTADGVPLKRYGLTVAPALDPAPVYLVTEALQAAVREGTGRTLYRRVPRSLAVAGKTGTTDGYRDSWFAGFTGDLLAVVWVGRDDHRPAGFSGAAAAMRLWGEIVRRLGPQPLKLDAPENIEFAWVESRTGRRTAPGCAGAVRLPFIRGSVPRERAACVAVVPGQGRGWWRRLFR